MGKDLKNWIEKSNALNTLSDIEKDMNLIEFRFFCLYLSKINARDITTRNVEISINDFENIFGVKFNTTNFNRQIRKIMSRTVEISVNNHKEILTLYSRFRYKINNPKVIEISCNDMMLPYLFELKSNYTSYMLANITKLNSVSKIRLYEVLKQYEKIGNTKIELLELQRMMCVNVSIFNDFKLKRLEPAIKDINEYTDIQVSYKKNLSCRKVVALTFTIKKKELALLVETVENVEKTVNNPLEKLYYRCNEAYTMEQLKIMIDYIENSGVKINISLDNYIYSVYANIKFNGNKVNNLFKYTLGVIKKQLDEHIYAPIEQKEEPKKEKPTKELNENFEEWKEIVRTYPRRMSNEECFYVLDDFDNTIGFVFECDFDKISNGTWRELDYRFKNGHLSKKSDLGRSLMSLKK